MKNMNYLVAAYVAIWAIFCVYLISVARRMANLQDDIRRLKEGGSRAYGATVTVWERTHQLRHFRATRESLLNLCRQKEGFLASLGMTDHRVFLRNLLRRAS